MNMLKTTASMLFATTCGSSNMDQLSVGALAMRLAIACC